MSAFVRTEKARFALLGALGLAIAGLSVAVGPGSLEDAAVREVLLSLRITRSAAAFVAGGALAVAGVAVQGIFQNPIASPSVLGTTAGAALGGHLLLLAQAELWPGLAAGSPADVAYTIACLLGSGLSLLVLLTLARRGMGKIALLLTGFILASLFGSLGSFVTALAQERFELGRALVSFGLGGVAGVGPLRVAIVAPLAAGATIALATWSRTLDVLASGDDEAASLGVDVAAARRWLIVWAAIAVGAAVALGGNVAFVGLVVPHAMRLLFGWRHAPLLPASFLSGGMFLVACDVLCRAAPSRSEIPLGVVTGLIGAPIFLGLLQRRFRELGNE